MIFLNCTCPPLVVPPFCPQKTFSDAAVPHFDERESCDIVEQPLCSQSGGWSRYCTSLWSRPYATLFNVGQIFVLGWLSHEDEPTFEGVRNWGLW